MKKTAFAFFIIAGIILSLGACSKNESYADKVKNEKKLIRNFLDEHNIEVLKTYPIDGVFGKDQYFLDETSGVYFNVVDSGNGKRAKKENKAEVYYRFQDTYPLSFSQVDTINYKSYIKFQYGIPETYLSANTSAPEYWYLSPGVTVPLQYVGEKAVVRLLVPFRNSYGSTLQTNSTTTLYYGNLEYTKIIN